MTSNRPQGQSVQKCELLLENNVFTQGQLYVALPRCEDPRNISISVLQDEFKTNHKANIEETLTRNIRDIQELNLSIAIISNFDLSKPSYWLEHSKFETMNS